MGSLWELKISSYRGISIGAEHWYPVLNARTVPRREIEVLRELSAEDIDILNKKDRVDHWKIGDTTNRFDTREDAKQAALTIWDAVHAPGDALVMEGYGNPSEVLRGPTGFRQEGNALWKKYKALHDDEGNDLASFPYGAWDRLSEKWGIKQEHQTVFGYGAPKDRCDDGVVRMDSIGHWIFVSCS